MRQLEKLKEVIHKARWIDGEIPTDEHLAMAVLEAGFVLPQVKLPTPVLVRHSNVAVRQNNGGTYNPHQPMMARFDNVRNAR